MDELSREFGVAPGHMGAALRKAGFKRIRLWGSYDQPFRRVWLSPASGGSLAVIRGRLDERRCTVCWHVKPLAAYTARLQANKIQTQCDGCLTIRHELKRAGHPHSVWRAVRDALRATAPGSHADSAVSGGLVPT